MTEHRISVNNGKYTFVVSPTIIRILRYGEPWDHQSKGQDAIHFPICELDAARVVLQAARNLVNAMEKMPLPLLEKLAKYDEFVGITRSVDQHVRLVSDNEPPSEWTK